MQTTAALFYVPLTPITSRNPVDNKPASTLNTCRNYSTATPAIDRFSLRLLPNCWCPHRDLEATLLPIAARRCCESASERDPAD
ncbi:uncharacterized protein TrAtP1_012204 [Trichoderma atroviride]|uniref:uncharacterized protein n=1 Tax=Hypocrea atroviridis TaxID=63577 RepID=UPI003329CF14|nr:hypothetical protein TrAtP1_012204 [Trichoderma atroviride]